MLVWICVHSQQAAAVLKRRIVKVPLRHISITHFISLGLSSDVDGSIAHGVVSSKTLRTRS